MPSQALVPTVIHLSSFSLTSSPHKQNTSVLLQWLHSWSLLGEMVGAWGVFGELWPDYFMHHEFTLGLLGLIAPLRGEERGWVGVLSSPSSHRCIITVRLLYLAAADAWRRLSSAGPGWCRLECDLCVYACVCTVEGSSISISCRISCCIQVLWETARQHCWLYKSALMW